ncbi:ovostatin-like [Eleutherodactylus coqui]|uniref:ovostatin-like n=1 Tax=Eleutherodactylus coqui TaxID=57060 RepID=UPI003461ECFF
MAKLCPILDFLDYRGFGGLPIPDEVHKKAVDELIAGYQRLLGCRGSDGQFSVFSRSFVPNLWLHVNMLHVFARMEEHIYVDKNLPPAMLAQLAPHQNLSTGCMTPVGSSFNYQFKNVEVAFTAFVITKLLGAKLRNESEPLLKGARRCLQAVDIKSAETFTLALVCNAAAMADLGNISNRAFTELKGRAIKKDGRIYWSSENVPTGQSNGCSSAEVDMTAQVLSCCVQRPEVDMDYCGMIAAHLSSCRNSKGGFVSSQDTTSASAAMTEFGKRIHVKKTNCEVVVSHKGIEQVRIDLTENNRFLAQKHTLPFTPGDTKVFVNGTCAPLIQIVNTYHTEIRNENSVFTLTVTPRADRCTGGVAKVINMDFCMTYRGSKAKSQMVLMTVKQLTGFMPDLALAYKMVDDGIVSHVENDGNSMNLYWESLPYNAKKCFTMTFTQENRVMEYRPGRATVSQYYTTGGEASAIFYHPCSPKDVKE